MIADGLNDQVEKLLDMCKRQNIVFCFGLRRRKLGYFNHGRGLVACIGVANYSGTEVNESVLLEEQRGKWKFNNFVRVFSGTLQECFNGTGERAERVQSAKRGNGCDY